MMIQQMARIRQAAGRYVRPELFVSAAALLAALLSIGWGREAHQIMLRNSVESFPPHMAAWMQDNLPAATDNVMKPDSDSSALRREASRLRRLAYQSDASDAAKSLADETTRKAQAARSAHFFDVDAMTAEAAPFRNFPRDRQQAALVAARHVHQNNPELAAKLLGHQSAANLPAELDERAATELGEAVLREQGTLPWEIAQRVESLQEMFKNRQHDQLPAALGELAHYVADLHQPLHVTKNYNGADTGNLGIHFFFETHMINRFAEHYQQAAAPHVSQYKYVDDPLEAAFQVVARNYEVLPVILKADAVARRQSGLRDDDLAELRKLSFDNQDKLMLRQDVDQLEAAHKRLVRHVDLLHQELLKAGDPAAERLGQSASMFASLVFTAWVNADRPALKAVSSAVASNPMAPPEATKEYVVVILIIGALLLLMIVGGSRLNRRRPPSKP